MKTVTLYEEYRENILECTHEGMVCVVNKDGIVHSLGDPDWTCYYRSASKLIQALPVFMRDLDIKYGLTARECAIFSGSHMGDEEHVEVLESILAKTGLKEEQLIILPTYPRRAEHKNKLLSEGKPPRKLYHNCSGKHIALMLLARDLGEPVEQYWIRESKTQHEILHVISQMTDVPFRDIRIGVDGCGVPVYAVPFQAIATSYLRLACPELLDDECLRQAIERSAAAFHAHPSMIAGYGDIVSLLNANPDLYVKDGAKGVFAIGIRSMGLGVVIKIMDGSHEGFYCCALHALRELGYNPAFVDEVSSHFSDVILNTNNEEAGFRKTVFSLAKY